MAGRTRSVGEDCRDWSRSRKRKSSSSGGAGLSVWSGSSRCRCGLRDGGRKTRWS